MWSVVVGVIGALLGVFIGDALQGKQASRNREWQREDSHNDVKRNAYSEYLRSISASYGQAESRQRNRSEDGRLHAATAEIEVLAGRDVSVPARDLVKRVIKAHSMIAEGASDEEAGVPEVDRGRYEVIDLFKADLGLNTRP
ncbi:hypothetical protein J7I98_30640 [Streptomyces sp. ISL-98]|uniref:hypothetical protein n=1 Tax=Streptomyces sp. ISL-98 TaxID=2819192 RepID=UPI001BEA02FE|nr:hypothetical protein [Streptomyces sp. ISL-98]MBT2510140.1 hypothetical protein [Streptomyces sp. ISL-98]